MRERLFFLIFFAENQQQKEEVDVSSLHLSQFQLLFFFVLLSLALNNKYFYLSVHTHSAHISHSHEVFCFAKISQRDFLSRNTSRPNRMIHLKNIGYHFHCANAVFSLFLLRNRHIYVRCVADVGVIIISNNFPLISNIKAF